MPGSSKGTRPTGWLYSYKIPGPLDDYYYGKLETRHEAIGRATILARRYGDGDWDVRAHKSMWREMESPTVCDYCGFEEWYLPLVRWHFVYRGENQDGKRFCQEECKARWAWRNDPDLLRSHAEAEA